MKKIGLILLIAFIVGCYLGYTSKIKESEMVEIEKTALAKENKKEDFSRRVTKQDGKVLISDVPLIQQMPELARGCEVTSLAMLLQYADVDVDKMELAERIKKVDTPYKRENGAYYYGNPNVGFVGDIYTFDKMGYGVYHKPVADLGEVYLPGKIADLTGRSFEEVLTKVEEGKPVWIIINSDFQTLPESEFRTWNTPTGQVQITWKEHSVVITGFDENHVYINDPLNENKNRKLPRNNFKAAWEQMGSQAISLK